MEERREHHFCRLKSLCEPDAVDSQESSDAADREDNKWPRDAMEMAFTCMKLAVDEYIEVYQLRQHRH